MPSAAVDTAFKARIAGNFTTIPTIGVSGVTEPPPNGLSFVVLQYPVVNGVKPVLGRHFFEEGAVRIVVNATRGPAENDAQTTWIPALASLFRDRKLGGGIETFTPSGPILNNMNDDGNFVSYSLIVPYRYQFADA